MTRNSLFHRTLLLLLIAASFVSCKAQQPGPRPLFTIYQTQHWDFPYGGNFEKVLYKAVLDIKDNHLTGILLAKKTSDTSLRVVFSNEMGMRFFDIEFFGENEKIHYMFPSMDKKMFVSILADDLKMIFTEDFTIKEFEREQREETVQYETESDRGELLYTVDRETSRIMNISTNGKKVKKTIINFKYGEDLTPKGVAIENPFIGLKMQMNLIKTE
jgi:hypothetical protein